MAKKQRESIRVCVRVRPPSQQELEKDLSAIDGGTVSVDPFIPDDAECEEGGSSCFGTQRISLKPGGHDRTFVMDRVFDARASQQQVGRMNTVDP